MLKYHSLAEQFSLLYPKAFFLDLNNREGLTDYLHGINFIENGEQITRLEKIGNGNMNCVLRADTGKTSFIIKQARPWTEKNPNNEAPCERIIEEAEYYKLASTHYFLKKYHPDLLFVDETSHFLILEDMGNVSDYTHLYEKNIELKPDEAKLLARYLGFLHSDLNADNTYERIYNRSIRKMNLENIFIAPLRYQYFHDFDSIQPGLKEIAAPYLEDARMVDMVKYLGRLYESDGNCLVHGNFCPESWLKTYMGIKIIDPEYCFFGHLEFDIGVFVAHLVLSAQPEKILQLVLAEYKNIISFDAKMAINFAGAEIFHRILAATQLPLHLNLREKKDIMDEARKMLVSVEESHLWPFLKN